MDVGNKMGENIVFDEHAGSVNGPVAKEKNSANILK